MENIVIYKALSYKLVGILFEVYNELGYGYQEKYYERAIARSLTVNQIKFKEQAPYKIVFKGQEIGKYYLDFIVESKIVLEIKKGDHFPKKNIEQIKGYLRATGFELAMLANFTSSGVRVLRVLNSKNYKKDL